MSKKSFCSSSRRWYNVRNRRASMPTPQGIADSAGASWVKSLPFCFDGPRGLSIVRRFHFDYQVGHLEHRTTLHDWPGGINKEDHVGLAAVVVVVRHRDPDCNHRAAAARLSRV